MYKLNGGKGAIHCNNCQRTVKAPAPEIWKALLKWNDIHYCDTCHPYKKFIRKVKDIIDDPTNIGN